MKGQELDKQIYPEGDNTWGCKSGWLDVEDVKKFIKELKKQYNLYGTIYPLLDELVGEKLI